MKTVRLIVAGTWALTMAAGALAGGSTEGDPAMVKLATHSGCLTCHAIAPPASSDGAKPIGPAWADVAAKYRGQPGAVQKLTATVMQGSNPYASHWAGKVTGLAMPPNAVAISHDEAEQLVKWILTLGAK